MSKEFFMKDGAPMVICMNCGKETPRGAYIHICLHCKKKYDELEKEEGAKEKQMACWKSEIIEKEGKREYRFKQVNNSKASNVTLKMISTEEVKEGEVLQLVVHMKATGYNQMMVKVMKIIEREEYRYIKYYGLSQEAGKFGSKKLFRKQGNIFGVIGIWKAYHKKEKGKAK